VEDDEEGEEADDDENEGEEVPTFETLVSEVEAKKTPVFLKTINITERSWHASYSHI